MTEESNNNYVVYCHTCPDGSKYFGMSKNIKNRWLPSSYKGCSLAPYIDKFGWDAITHEILYSNLTRDAALKIEGELISSGRKSGNCLNAYRSGHYQQSEQFKEELKAYQKDWNAEHRNEYQKAYDDEHREKIRAWQREYRAANREELNAKAKACMRELRKRRKEEK